MEVLTFADRARPSTSKNYLQIQRIKDTWMDNERYQ